MFGTRQRCWLEGDMAITHMTVEQLGDMKMSCKEFRKFKEDERENFWSRTWKENWQRTPTCWLLKFLSLVS